MSIQIGRIALPSNDGGMIRTPGCDDAWSPRIHPVDPDAHARLRAHWQAKKSENKPDQNQQVKGDFPMTEETKTLLNEDEATIADLVRQAHHIAATTGESVTVAAKKLGLSVSTYYYQAKKLDLPPLSQARKGAKRKAQAKPKQIKTPARPQVKAIPQAKPATAVTELVTESEPPAKPEVRPEPQPLMPESNPEETAVSTPEPVSTMTAQPAQMAQQLTALVQMLEMPEVSITGDIFINLTISLNK